MITSDDRKRLYEILTACRKSGRAKLGRRTELEDDVLSGALEAAFYVGGISRLKRVVSLVQEQAEAEARTPDGSHPYWASGWVEAGNRLIESLCEDLELLKQNLAGKNAGDLGGLGDLLDLEGVRHPQD